MPNRRTDDARGRYVPKRPRSPLDVAALESPRARMASPSLRTELESFVETRRYGDSSGVSVGDDPQITRLGTIIHIFGKQQEPHRCRLPWQEVALPTPSRTLASYRPTTSCRRSADRALQRSHEPRPRSRHSSTVQSALSEMNRGCDVSIQDHWVRIALGASSEFRQIGSRACRSIAAGQGTRPWDAKARVVKSSSVVPETNDRSFAE